MRAGVGGVAGVLRACAAGRAGMAHCAGALQAHLMCNVAERAWAAFAARAAAAPDLDSLIGALQPPCFTLFLMPCVM